MSDLHTRGIWRMYCWNALCPEQQEFLRTEGYLEIGYRPKGECPNPAEVEITTAWDEFPGPRFYCRACAIDYLSVLQHTKPMYRTVVTGSQEDDELMTGFDAIQEPRTLSDERESRPGRIGH